MAMGLGVEDPCTETQLDGFHAESIRGGSFKVKVTAVFRQNKQIFKTRKQVVAFLNHEDIKPNLFEDFTKLEGEDGVALFKYCTIAVNLKDFLPYTNYDTWHCVCLNEFYIGKNDKHGYELGYFTAFNSQGDEDQVLEIPLHKLVSGLFIHRVDCVP